MERKKWPQESFEHENHREVLLYFGDSVKTYAGVKIYLWTGGQQSMSGLMRQNTPNIRVYSRYLFNKYMYYVKCFLAMHLHYMIKLGKIIVLNHVFFYWNL